MALNDIFSNLFGGNDRGQYKKAGQDIRGREADRQKDIRGGKKSINQAFKQFDDGYYDTYRQTYVDNYVPQIDKQYETANGKLIAALAGRGTLESTAGIGKMGDLKEARDAAALDVANQAQDSANQLRTNVEDAKTNLYNLNLNAANPKAINTQAHASATALAAPQTHSTLGNVFASFAQPLAQGVQARRTQAPAYQSIYPGAGSGKVYG